MKTRLTHFIIMLAFLPVLASGCAKYDGALRVDVKADGVPYTCPEYSYDTYFPCNFEETEGGFMFSFCRYVTSSAGDQVTVLLRLNETAPFELYRPYALSGSAVEGGNYAVWDWTFKSTDGYVTFLARIFRFRLQQIYIFMAGNLLILSKIPCRFSGIVP